jgi:hypothetical protein
MGFRVSGFTCGLNKFQITKYKSQTNHNNQNSKFQTYRNIDLNH